MTENKTLKQCAALLGVGHARNFQRYETGAIDLGSVMTEKIRQMTGSQVTLEDLHEQRLEWLRENDPDAAARLPVLEIDA